MEESAEVLNLEQYCSQTVKDLRFKANLPIDNNESKTTVMVQAAKAYLDKGLISQETYDTVSDPRYVRLYSLRVTKLKEMLRLIGIDPPIQGKSKIVILCYQNNMDAPAGVSVSLSSDISQSEDRNSPGQAPQFLTHNGEIYFSDGKNYTKMTQTLVQQLMTLVWNRKA